MALCECGCGDQARSGSFLPGHDQRLRTELERRVGGLLALRSLIETAEAFAAGELPSAHLDTRVRAILSAAQR